MVEDNPKSRKEIEIAKWKRNESGILDIKPLTNIGTALLGQGACGIRIEYLDGESADSPRSTLQLGMSAGSAHAFASALSKIGHAADKTDPRKKDSPLFELATTRSQYKPAKECIYCGATPSKLTRPLGEEHIIPRSLKGEWILPEAACGCCENEINKEFEQFCNKITFGPLRHYLGLPSSSSPTELSVALKVEGEAELSDRLVPIDSIPTLLMLPLFPLPGICRGLKPDDEGCTLATKNYWSKDFIPTNTSWLEENKIESVRTAPASIIGKKFASLIAKIAHSYAAAECGERSILIDVIKSRPSAQPLGYLIGGEEHVLPPTNSLHELELIRCHTKKDDLLVVRVRLFAKFGAPTYYAVVGATPRNRRPSRGRQNSEDRERKSDKPVSDALQHLPSPGSDKQ